MPLRPLTLSLPDWIEPVLAGAGPLFPTTENRMQFVIQLARHNVDQRTGGPFAAAVFERDTGKLISPGVNLVTTSNCSIAHAEMIALALAQQKLGTYDLADGSSPPCQLVSSCEPCAMCLGAIPWSGVAELVCAARDEDARAIGFDEGHKPPDWPTYLKSRHITITRDLLRPQAVEVLQHYQNTNGQIYNPSHPDHNPT